MGVIIEKDEENKKSASGRRTDGGEGVSDSAVGRFTDSICIWGIQSGIWKQHKKRGDILISLSEKGGLRGIRAGKGRGEKRNMLDLTTHHFKAMLGTKRKTGGGNYLIKKKNKKSREKKKKEKKEKKKKKKQKKKKKKDKKNNN